VAHATGIGFVDPSGLKNRNFKKRQQGILRAKRQPIDLSLTFRVVMPRSIQQFASDVPLE
jgi:hypothetical protein